MPLVQEYMVRKYLAAIGIDDTALGSIPWDHALELAEIASAGIEIEAKKAEKAAKKRRRP